jgi:hypothetical protein
MRTKALLLTGVLGAALGSASLMAQVYSLNAVGYINVTLPAGFSLIADPLYDPTSLTNTGSLGAGLANYISPVLDNTMGASTNSFVNCQVFKYVQSGSSYYEWGFTKGSIKAYLAGTGPALAPLNGNTNASTAVTFNPGEALWFNNANSTNMSITFVGTVPQGNATNATPNALTNTMYSGFNLISSIVPIAGAVDKTVDSNAFGLNTSPFDAVYIYTGSGYAQYTMNKKNTGWSVTANGGLTNTYPVVAVGQPFWYSTTNVINNWVQNFTVSP